MTALEVLWRWMRRRSVGSSSGPKRGDERYLHTPSKQTRTFALFISSGDDAASLRDRVEDVLQVVAKQFADAGSLARFDVDRWEAVAPQRAPQGRSINDLFVQRAKNSSLTLVLLFNEIRAGTLEEIAAALEVESVQVAVLWFDLAGQRSLSGGAKAAAEYLEEHRDQLLYKRITQAPDSHEAWLEIIRVVSRFIASAVEDRDKTSAPSRITVQPKDTEVPQ